jgi:small-conductance mechanosensitive channel
MKTLHENDLSRFVYLLILVFFFLLSWHVIGSSAQAENLPGGQEYFASAKGRPTALQSDMVVLDGRNLFRVAGIESYSARRRASDIEKRIKQLAEDPSFDPTTLTVNEDDGVYAIKNGDREIIQIHPADVFLEGNFSPERYAKTLVRESVVLAIKNYREERSLETLKKNALKALFRTACLFVILALLFWSFTKFDQVLERRFKSKIEKLESKSKRIFQARQIWTILSILLRFVRIVVVLLIIYLFLNFVLGLFPWTRHFANTSLSYVVNPLHILGQSFIDYLPSLFFLLIIYFLVHYLLGFTKAFFNQLGRGQFQISGFDAEWALPTYRIVRVFIIILAVVVAYPYLPGSGSEAFKGISILVGILFSLGSTSLIANIIAGYTMTYRRAFKVGDRVKFGEHFGEVTDIRLMETHVRSLKNEEIVIPNSKILSGEVINYSSMASKHGLILHTTVGIGYEVPWRQVEAMLLMAAERTQGLPRKSEPFVLQKTLGDFGVTYELNVMCRDAENMAQIYSDLHRNIQDVFNEYEVAIMTPHYVGDTEEPKIVPKDKWFDSPAQKSSE